MFNHEIYAATLARAVEVMRIAESVDQQKAALRSLVALAASGSATIRCYDGQLSVDDVGIPEDVQHIGTLAGRLAAHGIEEIAIGRQAEPAELLALLRGLAEPAGGPSVKDRLFSVKSRRIWVLMAEDADAPPRRRESISGLFAGPDAPPLPGAAKKKLKKEDEEALAAWNEMHDDGVMPGAVKNIDLGISMEAEVEPDLPPPPPPPPAPAPRAPMPEPELPIATGTRLGAALLAIARRPFDGNLLDRLTGFSDAALAEVGAGNVNDTIRALAFIARLEPQAPEGTARNSYRIALRRVLSGETLTKLAPLIADAELGADASQAFARSGSDGLEVLLGLLAKAENIRERKAFMNAIKAVPSGHDMLVQMLGHPQWFVARNVAELAGELKLESATAELSRLLLSHGDARVRKAAAIALAKIGTQGAHEALLRALREAEPETKTQVASLVGAAQGATFTLPLAALLDTEEDPDVLRETCLALGRIGSADAVSALERAQKGGGMFSRRARALKESAEQALKKARGR